MKTNINNYKVNGIILSGDYICTDQTSNIFLLCNSKIQQNLLEYRNLIINNIIFPVQFTYMDQQLYKSFPLSFKMIHCLSKIKYNSYSQTFLLKMMKKLINIMIEVKKIKNIRDEVLSSLSLDNLWFTKTQIYLIWNLRSEIQLYSEDSLITKLGQIFFFLVTGKLFVGIRDFSYITNQNIKALIFKMISSRQEKITLQLIIDFFNNFYPNNPKQSKKKNKKLSEKKKMFEQTRIYLQDKNPWVDINKKSIDSDYMTFKINHLRMKYRNQFSNGIYIDNSAIKRNKPIQNNNNNRYFQNFRKNRTLYKSIDQNYPLSKLNKNQLPFIAEEENKQIKLQQTLENITQKSEMQKRLSIQTPNIDIKQNLYGEPISKERLKLEHLKTIRRYSGVNEDSFRQNIDIKLMSWNRKYADHKHKPISFKKISLTQNLKKQKVENGLELHNKKKQIIKLNDNRQQDIQNVNKNNLNLYDKQIMIGSRQKLILHESQFDQKDFKIQKDNLSHFDKLTNIQGENLLDQKLLIGNVLNPDIQTNLSQQKLSNVKNNQLLSNKHNADATQIVNTEKQKQYDLSQQKKIQIIPITTDQKSNNLYGTIKQEGKNNI